MSTTCTAAASTCWRWSTTCWTSPRSTAGHLTLQEDQIDIREALATSLRMVEGQAGANGVTIEQEIAHELPILRADERRIRQILLNLLSNAVKFTPRGGMVRLIAFVDEREFVVQVADTGIGMAKEDIPRALERFGQLDSDLNRKYEGTGLGLPLTKKLAELHWRPVGDRKRALCRHQGDRRLPGRAPDRAVCRRLGHC
jgi:signal transduction histidine kinase